MTMEPVRCYIAALNALGYEALLGREKAFFVLGSTGDGQRARREIFTLQPDLLLLDGALPGLDGLALLDEMSAGMPAPPRVVYLCAGDAWQRQAALQKGADGTLDPLESPSALLAALQKTAVLPLPGLAAPWERERLHIAEGLLAQLEISPRLKGAGYIRLAIAALACAPQLGQSFSGRLYPYIGEACGAAPAAVERAIRTAVEATWLRGSLSAIQALFGFSVDAGRGKPTNAEFLSMLACHARRQLARRMEEPGEKNELFVIVQS